MQLKHAVQATFDEIIKILCWSLRCLAVGVKLKLRHDGLPFDDKRHKLLENTSSELGVRAVLGEIRGDWKWLQKLYKFPAWNKKDGFCWL